MAFPIMGTPDTGDTAWMLASSALVLLMTPGLAFFYGGMVRAKNVLNMMMMSISAMGLVGVLWVLYGFSEAFGEDKGHLIGDPWQYFGLKTLFGGTYANAVDAHGHISTAVSIPLAGGGSGMQQGIPALVFVAFQLMFAIITVALISGAVADRLKFGAWLLFAGLWATVVYFPVAHWVFSFNGVMGNDGGWIANHLKAIDFAGGTAVHINAGAAGLALCIVLGRRKGWPKSPIRPHNLPFVQLGAGLLWFGWYGFNAGSATASNGAAAATFVTTTVATCAAMLAWLLVERIRDGHATSLGAASGIVAGLVAITPSCSSVNVIGALAIGVAGGAICALTVGLKFRFGFDDSLDVVGVHMIGGIIGTLMVGLVATDTAPAAVKGLFYGGGWEQLKLQAIGAFSVLGYSFIMSLILAFLVKGIMKLFRSDIRVTEEAEDAGLDESEHAESAYDSAALGGKAMPAQVGAKEAITV